MWVVWVDKNQKHKQIRKQIIFELSTFDDVSFFFFEKLDLKLFLSNKVILLFCKISKTIKIHNQFSFY